MKVDFGRTADDYATHRAGFPAAILDRLRERGIGLPGQTVVDVGTGTGTLARLFASSGCHVTGLDPSAPLLERAAELDRDAGVTVTYAIATAEDTALPAGFADVYTAGQCWHWFDRPKAALEAKRILRPDGWIVICHFDWLPLRGSVVAATEELISRHNPDWAFAGGTGIHPAWTIDVAEAGFRDIETFSFDTAVHYSPDGWRGRIRASAGVGGSLPTKQIDAFDRDLADLLADRFPAALSVPHRVWALTAQRPG